MELYQIQHFIVIPMNKTSSEQFSKWNKSVPKYDEFQEMIVDCITEDTTHQMNILDLGVGKGGTAVTILNRFPNSHYCGVDKSNDAIIDSKIILQEFQNIDLILDELLEFNIEKKYDVIAAALSLHHLDKDNKFDILNKIFHWLKPNGVFIWGDLVKLEDEKMNQKAIKYFQNFREGVLNEEEKKKVKEHIENEKHIFHTIAEMKDMLNIVGFNKVDIVWTFYRLVIFRITK